MTFALRDHTADVAVEATGDTLGEAMAAVADGMAAAMCDDVPETGGDRHEVTVTAEGPTALLFDYLDGLIYERDVDSVLPVDNRATVRGPETATDGRHERVTDSTETPSTDAWQLSGSYRGVPLADVVARDLKAVTYSDMELRETEAGWRAYVVFDV